MKAKILIVDDEEALCRGLAKLLEKDGFDVDCSFSGEDAIEKLDREDYHLVYLDYMLPGIDGLQVLKKMNGMHITTPVVFLTAHGDDETGLESIRLGAREFLFKPCNSKNLRFKAFLWLKSDIEHAHVRQPGTAETRTGDMLYRSDAMKEVAVAIEDAAPSNVPVLITGETGVGKELVAEELMDHPRSPRKDAPRAILNCAAIPEPLMESELFGHAKGAFTGAASNKKGFFETVDGGTLFLDELSSASLQLQAKLLRILEKGEFYRVGETELRTTDVRVIAATNRNLDKEIENGNFREDLYHRLCVMCIDVPPLRERREDIELLIDHFLPVFNAEAGKDVRIDRKAIQALSAYYWPGNVRELKHLVQNLVLRARKNVIDASDLPGRIVKNSLGKTILQYSDMKSNIDELTNRYEKDYLKDLIIATGGNVSQAARMAGISRAYVIRKLKAHNINPADLKGPAT